jgi:hypothetical protein
VLVINPYALIKKDFQTAATEFFIWWVKDISGNDGKIKEEAETLTYKASQKAFLTNKAS